MTALAVNTGKMEESTAHDTKRLHHESGTRKQAFPLSLEGIARWFTLKTLPSYLPTYLLPPTSLSRY